MPSTASLPLPLARLLVPLVLILTACGEDEPPMEEPPGPPEPFGVMTFNVLCSFCDASYDPWTDRLEYFGDIFSRYEPDLIGLQELAFASEVGDVLALRPGYASVSFVNPDSHFAYPDATLLYRTERFEERSHGEYWLSPTPDVPSSTGFADMQVPRLVVWAELVDKRSRRSLYFATTHFDNNSPSQEKSAPLVLEQTAPWSERMPVVVVGDFNSQPSDPAYVELTTGNEASPPLTNAQDLAATSTVEHNQASAPAYDYDERIDHIFVAPEPAGEADWAVERWSADLFVYGPQDRYPSDHFAVFARLLAPEM
jgi:endonuclease/exonuclease/phosphatase family metal-dependent hydrolase